MTLTITLTVSPGPNSGTERLARMALICSRSSSRMAVMGVLDYVNGSRPDPSHGRPTTGRVVGNRPGSSPEPPALSMPGAAVFLPFRPSGWDSRQPDRWQEVTARLELCGRRPTRLTAV